MLKKFWLETGLLHIFITFFLIIIEHSVVDIFKLTSELQSRQINGFFKKNEVSSLIVRLSN